MEPMADAGTAELRLLEKAKAAKVPVNGSFELSPLCNMNCDMCYVRLSPEEQRRKGRLRTAEEWLALGREMKAAGVLFLLLTGGEPLLYPGFREVYLGLKELGFILTVNTNGTLLDEGWADFFGQNPPRRVNITLYGADGRAYDRLCHYEAGFEKTVRAVKLLQERKVDVRLGLSLTRENYPDLERWIDLAEELGVFYNVDTYMTPASRERDRSFDGQSRLSPEDAAAARVYTMRRSAGAEFWQQAAKTVWMTEHLQPEEGPLRIKCLAGNCSFTVNWQGELRPCVVADAPAVNVFETGFPAAWKTVSSAVAELAGSTQCSACGLRLLCNTCVTAAVLETGRADGVPEYLCRYGKASYALLCEQLRERAAGENQ